MRNRISKSASFSPAYAVNPDDGAGNEQRIVKFKKAMRFTRNEYPLLTIISPIAYEMQCSRYFECEPDGFNADA